MENHWIGVVLDTGDGCPACGLEFGDTVLLNRWANSRWLFRTTPIGHESKEYLLRSEDGLRQFECLGKDHWCFVEPDKIPFVCMKWNWMLDGRATTDLTAGPKRVLIELINRQSSIINPEWSRAAKMTGKIISVGHGVEDVEVGQYVIVNPMRGIRYQEPPEYDKWFVSIHADYIEAIGTEEDFKNISEVNAVWPS